MKILELQVTDLKRIVAVDIKPQGNVVEIAGKNGQGKTSILDAIWWTLGGKKNVTSKPVRDGAEAATVRMDLGDLVVVRKFKPDGTGTITVSNADGARYQSPQEMLDRLVGELTFDPLAFVRKDGRSQLEMLRSFVPDVDFDDLERREKDAFENRRFLARDLRHVEVILADIGDLPELPDEIDTADLTKLLELLQAENDAARSHNREIELKKSAYESGEAQISAIDSEMDDLQQQFDELKNRRDVLRRETDTRLRELSKLGSAKEIEDISPIMDQIRRANESTRERAAIASKHAAVESHRKRREDLAAKVDQATKDLEAVRNERTNSLKQANLPIEGLEMTATGILFNDQPLEQASDAEQLRVGVALAMAANPKLRVVRIRDGSLMDDDAMKLLHQMADENDFQVWIEVVGSGHEGAIVIEGGQVKDAAPAQGDLLDG